MISNDNNSSSSNLQLIIFSSLFRLGILKCKRISCNSFLSNFLSSKRGNDIKCTWSLTSLVWCVHCRPKSCRSSLLCPSRREQNISGRQQESYNTWHESQAFLPISPQKDYSLFEGVSEEDSVEQKRVGAALYYKLLFP